MKTFTRAIAAGLCFWAGVCLVAAPASAHRISVFAWVEGETVFLESKFAGGKKVQGGQIVVVDPEGHELLRGVTDERGEFSFKVPQRTDLKIILTAGQGHRAEWTIPAAEIEPGAAEPLTQSNAGKGASSTMPAAQPSSAAPAEAIKAIPAADLKQLEILIESILDKKLKPITKMLADAHDRGPSVRDILGGIGYILGLVGIAAYFHSRKKRG